jgi:hypothetical protein
MARGGMEGPQQGAPGRPVTAAPDSEPASGRSGRLVTLGPKVLLGTKHWHRHFKHIFQLSPRPGRPAASAARLTQWSCGLSFVPVLGSETRIVPALGASI